jgi:alkanesulfonate monooxygenase SsuD/methylene tetrahydromethanopterin reductase-like flavin-dependent oxidoreductase (luciferase family)
VLDRECERQGRDPASLRFSAFAQNTVIGTSNADVARKVARLQREFDSGTRGLLAEPLSTWFTATADEAVERLSEWRPREPTGSCRSTRSGATWRRSP